MSALMEVRPFPAALAPLVDLPRWVVWNGIPGRDKEGNFKLGKPPLRLNGWEASTTTAEHMTTYREVVPHLQAGRFHGAGFAPWNGSGLLFIDIDNCRDVQTGAIAPWAQEIVDLCCSYTEVSPTGQGLHIFGYADGYTGAETKEIYKLSKDLKEKRGGEIYLGSNYVTVTFNRLPNTPDWLGPIGAAGNEILRRWRQKAEKSPVGEDSERKSPFAPIDVVRETLALIPNEQVNWHYWKETIGMAVFASTAGSDEGLAAWDEWSRKNKDAYEGGTRTCEEEWDRLRASPPNRSTYGTLWHEAKTAEAAAGRDGWTGGPLFKAWKAREAVAGLSELPVLPGEAPAPAVWEQGSGVGLAAGGSGKPVIQVIDGRLSETVDAAEQAMIASGQPIYTRDRILVAPVAREVRTRGDGKALMVGLHELRVAAIRDMLSKAATWQKYDGRRKKLVACDPPKDIAQTVLERVGARVFPEVSNVIATPSLLMKGGLSCSPGFDAALGIHRMADRNLRMPEGWQDLMPIKANAESAIALINGLLVGFPFVEPMDRSVALALMLTSLCRVALPVAPVFAISATAAGSGKSHLVDLASVIATGMRCPAASAGETVDETEKRLGGLVFAGYPIVSIDNFNGVLRSTLLSQVSTQDRVQIRLLGKTEMHTVESRTVWCVNGNGLVLSGDLVRRTLPCNLDAAQENPERRDFAFDPVRRVEDNRGPYVAAILTVLRAHAAAGFPGAQHLTKLGSFDEWSRHVRGALVWLGYIDPVEAMNKARAEDPDVTLLRDMLQGWLRRFGSEKSYTSQQAVLKTVGGPLQALKEDDPEIAARQDLTDAMLRVAGDRGVVDPRKLSYWMRRYVGRVQSGLKFVKDTGATGHDNVVKWKVEIAQPKLRLVDS